MSTPYIGSKISLISRLDIRYEGTLYQVDPLESTISLSQVRSFGTEDRLAPVQVPARAEVYEFIIFKASDIKDLIVCEETPTDPNVVVDITYDPAIVSVSKPPANATGEQQKPVVEQQQQRITDDKTSQNSSSPKLPQEKQKKPQPLPVAPPPYIPPPNVPSAYLTPPPVHANNQLSYRTALTTGNAAHSQQTESNFGGFGQRPQRSFVNRSLGGAEHKSQQSQGVLQPFSNSNFIQQPSQHQQQSQSRYYQLRQPLQQQGYHHQQQQQYGWLNSGGQARRGGGAYQSSMNRQPYHYHNNFRAQQFHPQQQQLQRYDGDFDFEKANQQFQTIGDLGDKIAELGLNEIEKLPSIRTSGRGSARGSEERSISTGSSNNNDKNCSSNKSPLVSDNFYDKNASFFDNISCDALEREEGKNNRVDWKKERITNQETFGPMARTMMYYQRGGGGRGGAGPWSSSMYRGGYNSHNNHHHHHNPQQYYHHQRNNHHHHNNPQPHRFSMQRQHHSAALQQPQQLQQQ